MSETGRRLTSNPEALLQAAIARHGAGRLAEAEALCREVLRLAPRHADALHLLGVIALQGGRLADGVELIRRSVEINPRQPFALTNLALALADLGRDADALATLDRVVDLQPASAAGWRYRADMLRRLGKLEEALQSYTRALALDPLDADAHVGLGRVHAALERLEDAVGCFAAALRLRPGFLDAMLFAGSALLRLGRAAAALAHYDEALRLDPRQRDAWLNRAYCLTALERHAEALECCERAIALEPSRADACNYRGFTLLKLERPLDALAAIDRALELDERFVLAHTNRGNALVELGRIADAIRSYERALALDAHDVDALGNLGYALVESKRADEALERLDGALRLRPDDVNALNNRGRALTLLNRPQEALASFDLALRRAPRYVNALCNRATALLKLGRREEALAACDRALALDPDHALALGVRAAVLSRLRLYDRAAQSLVRALERDPKLPYALGDLVHARLHCCDWEGFSPIVERLGAAVRDGLLAAEPFALLAIDDEPAEQRLCAARFSAEQCPVAPAPQAQRRRAHERLRVAYLSADMRQHPVAYLLAPLLERHDRTRFEVTGVSFGPATDDAMARRLRGLVDAFLDVRELSDRAIADLLREREVDIAIDLTVYTQHGRPQILALRPAPVQATFLGYPGTSGAPCVDYLIADDEVVPEERTADYSECVVRLPDCYLPADDTRPFPEHTPTRAEVGLPERGFVFCCFNNSYKITPDVYACWMRVLRETPDSVLWLRSATPVAADNLRGAARRAGVAPERILFAERAPLAEHIARHRLADLFLDTRPYNAHSTAADALWAGLPVLTCRGRSFVSRVAASLLRCVALPELVTDSLEHYTERALHLARHPEELAALRARLARNRLTSPLFDSARFARHFEAALLAMHDRHTRGLPPESFRVPSLPRAERG